MTEKNTFNPVRSAAIRQMLVQEAARTTGKSRRDRSPRIMLIVSAAVAGLLLVGGSTAWALGVRPFASAPAVPAPTASQAPTSTSTSTPTPTPSATSTATPVVDPAAPKSGVAVGCSQLVPSSTLTALLPEATLRDSPAIAPLRYAALREKGVIGCFWTGTRYRNLEVEVSPNLAAGQKDVAAGKAAGYGSLHVGDASSAQCGKIAQGCGVTLVVGSYWANISYDNAGASQTRVSSAMLAVVQSMVAELRAHPAGATTWAKPSSRWASFTDCGSLLATHAIGTAAHAHLSLLRPATGSQDGILLSAQKHLYLTCDYGTSQPSSVPADGATSVGVEIAQGARWAFEESKPGGTRTAVRGAEDAYMHCFISEQECVLDVLTDNTWMRFSLTTTGDLAQQKHLLILVAKAMVALPVR